MVSLEEKKAMCSEAVSLWGEDAQSLMVIEEAAELIIGVCKRARSHNPEEAHKRNENIAEELADNRVMAHQLMYMRDISAETVDAYENFKWDRLRKRINTSEIMRSQGRD